MTYRTLFTLSLRPIWRRIRRSLIKFQIEHISYALAHLKHQQALDRHEERVLMSRQAMLRSQLIDL